MLYSIRYRTGDYCEARKTLMYQIGQNRIFRDEWVVDHGNGVKELYIDAR